METISQTEEQELEELLQQELEQEAELTHEEELREGFELEETGEQDQLDISVEVPPDIVEQFGEGNWQFDNEDIRRYSFDFEKGEQLDENGVSITQEMRAQKENPFVAMHEDVIANWSAGEAAYIPYTKETENGIEQYVTKSWVEADGTVVSMTWKRELEKTEVEEFDEEEHTEFIVNEEENGELRFELAEEQEDAHEDYLFAEHKAEAVESYEEVDEVIEDSQTNIETIAFDPIEKPAEEPRVFENIVTEPFPDYKKEIKKDDEEEPLIIRELEGPGEHIEESGIETVDSFIIEKPVATKESVRFEETGISIVEASEEEIKTKETGTRTTRLPARQAERTDRAEDTEEIVEKQKEEIKIEKTAEETGISIVETENTEEIVRTTDTTDEQIRTDEATELKKEIKLEKILEINDEIKLVPDTKEDESIQEKHSEAPKERVVPRVEGEAELTSIELPHETPRTVPEEESEPQIVETELVDRTDAIEEIRFTPLNSEAEKIAITRVEKVESSFVKTAEDKKEELIQKEIKIETKQEQKEEVKLEKDEIKLEKEETVFEERTEIKNSETFRKIDIQKPIHIKMNNNSGRQISGTEIINRLFGYKPQVINDDEVFTVETNAPRRFAGQVKN